MQKQSHSTTPKLAAVNGIAVQINPASDKSHRQVPHGKQVNSSTICQMGVLAAAYYHTIARSTETHLG